MSLPKSRFQHFLLAGLLGLLAFLAGLPGIHGTNFSHDNEAYYVLGAQEMLETGQYLCPLYIGEIHLDKPPPYYWLVAGAYRVFGLSLFSARLPSLIAGALAVLLVYAFALQVFGCARTSLFASLAMMSFSTVYRYSRLSMTDLWMTLGTLSGLFFFVRASISEKRILNLFLASLGVGVAGLMKGHVGIVVGAFPILAFYVLSWRTPARLPFRCLLLPTTWLPALLLSGWWYLFLFTCHQPASEFSSLYKPTDPTLSEITRTFFTGEAEERSGWGIGSFSKNLFHSLGYLLVDYGPWSWCLLVGFCLGNRVLREEWRTNRQKVLPLLAMMASIFVLFAVLIQTRRNARYFLPMAPALAILAGRYLHHWTGTAAPSKRLLLPLGLSFALILSYNAIFGLLMPCIRGEPLQELCDFLKPRLRDEDRVVFYDVEETRFLKKHALAMGALGHRTRYETGHPNEFLRFIACPEPSAPPARGATYVVTTDTAWQQLPPAGKPCCQVLKEAALYAKWRSFRAVKARFRNQPEQRLILLRLHAPGSEGGASPQTR
jgi:4-amino-4-deoxy-L-arabinose transferase-like glycosyltransferase